MNAAPEPAWPLTVYYDGGCIVCATEIAHYRRLEHAGRLHFVDISAPGFRAEDHGLSLDQFRSRMQVRDAEGAFRSGVEAFVALWQALPGKRYRKLAQLVQLPVLRKLAGWGYTLFARYRHLLPKRDNCHDGRCDRP